MHRKNDSDAAFLAETILSLSILIPVYQKEKSHFPVFDRYISVIEKPKVYFDKVIDFDLWIKSLTVSLDVGATRS
ncbi:hypothetical protein HR15_05355 [Porphyromonas gulae]|uniref:Uncharacterized protein n=1 Tax=Porphyromonas gulae TaxID=111105 RepID=A0A0A2FDB7_9PORP|nr:hypothetical protein HR15_05355 [Porphyromonas gulae]